MLRSAFLKRMALAAAACAFIDVPWPKPRGDATQVVEIEWSADGERWARADAATADVNLDGSASVAVEGFPEARFVRIVMGDGSVVQVGHTAAAFDISIPWLS